MRYNDNYASASANVTASKSDLQITREHLIDRAKRVKRDILNTFDKTFNLYVDNTPKTYKELIEIIKAKTYTIDKKIAKQIEQNEESDLEFPINYGPTYGIIWPGPVADFDGCSKATDELNKALEAVIDTIMVKDGDAGLAALEEFKNWTPTGKAN